MRILSISIPQSSIINPKGGNRSYEHMAHSSKWSDDGAVFC